MKLYFPAHLANTPCKVSLNTEGVSEDGGSIPALNWEGKCWFSEKTRTTIDTEGKTVKLEGSVIIQGDIAPTLAVISDGKVEVAGKSYTLYRGSRPRNPDGTIHHTTLELM